MKTTLKFFKDMGVCDGAYATLEKFFVSAGVSEYDYDAGYELMLGMMDYLEEEAKNSNDPNHDTAQGWLEWCYELRERPEAIMYFGDHIEENLFRTSDNYLYETLSAAQEHRARVYQELRDDHASKRVINGVKVAESGAETWSFIDLQTADVTEFDAFVWHDAETGLNHRTVSPTVAAVFDAEQQKVLDAINAAEQAAKIKHKITDESGQYSVWVEVEE